MPATFSQDSLALWALEAPVAWSSATWLLVTYRTLNIRYMSHAVYIIQGGFFDWSAPKNDQVSDYIVNRIKKVLSVRIS